MNRFSIAGITALALAALACNSAVAAQRTFVASYGNDANIGTNCGFLNPCRSFTAAQSVTDAGGEIVAIDAAGYGPIAITKSITVTANPGFYAGISASSGDAVSISQAGANVILRGLNINGIGAVNGVHMTLGSSLSIENCVISNFANNGIWVQSTSRVRISDSVIRGNGNDGIALEAGATGSVVRTKANANGRAGILVQGTVAATTATLSVTESDVASNQYGLIAWATNAAATGRLTVSRTSSTNNQTDGVAIPATSVGTAIISIGDSQVTGNTTTGMNNAGGGTSTFESLGNNLVRQNGANTAGTITPISGI
jgi:parallel beta-helix repeat protein